VWLVASGQEVATLAGRPSPSCEQSKQVLDLVEGLDRGRGVVDSRGERLGRDRNMSMLINSHNNATLIELSGTKFGRFATPTVRKTINA
jgi:hypothetical protein